MLKSLIRISRSIFSRTIIWFIPYSIIYAILILFFKNLSWHFYIKSVEVLLVLVALLIIIPGVLMAEFTTDEIEDYE
jgi:hypothetical protein